MYSLMIQLVTSFFITIYSLVVTVDNVKNNEGYLYVAIYSNEKGFPIDIAKSDKILKVKAHEGKVTVRFKDLEEGTYSVSVFHDVNNDEKLNTSFIGIPKEPIGVSNDAKGFMGPPSFEACALKLKGMKEIKINLSEL